MDDHLHALGGDHHHDLQEVPGPIGADDQPAVWVLSGIFGGEVVIEGMEHVFFGDGMPTSRTVELHTALVYYEKRSRRVVVSYRFYAAANTRAPTIYMLTT